MDRNLQLRSSPNSWGRMGSSSPAYHRTTLHQMGRRNVPYRRLKWPWPSKCSMGKQVHPLANFLLLNRSTPHTVRGQLPAELFLGRQIKNCSHYWSRIWTEQWKKNGWNRKSTTMKGASSFVSSNWMRLSWFVTGEVELKSGFREGSPKWKLHAPTLFAVGTKDVLFMWITWKERVQCNPSLGSVAGGRENSRVKEMVESQAAEKDCLLLPEPLSSEFITPSPENSVVAGNAEEQLVPKEAQDSVLGDTLRGTSNPGLPLSPPSAPRYPRRERKAPSRLTCEM